MKDNSIHIMEVGPRDGFQFISTPIPTNVKLEVIRSILHTGMPQVQVTSFVRPDLVPQMKDAKEVISELLKSDIQPSRINALVLNRKGLELALKTGIRSVEISFSVNDQHGRRNAGMTLKEALLQVKEMIGTCKSEGIEVRAGLQCVFGYLTPGDSKYDVIQNTLRHLVDLQPNVISLADTTGMGNPSSIREVLEFSVPLAKGIPVGLHLHDTRGLGLANVLEALKVGIRHFDSSLGGLGGCPFVDGAAGNIASEDLIYMLASLGYKTGIDLEKLASAGVQMSSDLSIQLPSKIHELSRLGTFKYVG